MCVFDVCADVIKDGSDRRTGGQLRTSGGRTEELGSPRAGQGGWQSARTGRCRERATGAEQVARKRKVSASQEKHGPFTAVPALSVTYTHTYKSYQLATYSQELTLNLTIALTLYDPRIPWHTLY